MMGAGVIKAFIPCAAILALVSGLAWANPASPDHAALHLLAAQRQAKGHPVIEAQRQTWCGLASAPASTEDAAKTLEITESAFREAVYGVVPAVPDQRLRLVVQRECAAFHAARLQLKVQHPVWLYSTLKITRARPSAVHGHGLQVQAKASNIDGPVVNSRITFSQGSHFACFGLTDAKGMVSCTMVDTHPHNPGGSPEEDDDAHGGPLTATLAGAVSSELVHLPAVVQRAMPESKKASKHASH